MTRKIDILGPLPPPHGGVSSHVVRYRELLAAEGHQVGAHAYTGSTARGRVGKTRAALSMLTAIHGNRQVGRGDVLHVHYGGFGYFMGLAPLLARTRARKVITFHSMAVVQDLERKATPLRRWALSLLDDFDLFVCVREGIGEKLREWGLEKPEITIMPAFLPPSLPERDPGRLPPAVAADLADGQSGRLRLCCGAYYLGPGYGRDDLYGVEALLEILAALDDDLPCPVDLWVLVSNPPDTEEQKRAEAAVVNRAARLVNVDLRLHFGLPLVPVMAACGGFVRPSREDGDSVAIREALGMGLAVLASDVVARPPGTETFPLDQPDTARRRVREFIAGLASAAPTAAAASGTGDDEKYRRFVRTVMNLPDPPRP